MGITRWKMGRGATEPPALHRAEITKHVHGRTRLLLVLPSIAQFKLNLGRGGKKKINRSLFSRFFSRTKATVKEGLFFTLIRGHRLS